MHAAIIGREITMSALREWGAALGPEAHQAVAVSSIGKWKTASQMISLALLLGVKTTWVQSMSVASSMFADAGIAFLCIATCLTMSSLLSYFRGLWKFMS